MCEYLKMVGRPQDDPEVIAFMQKYDWKGRFQRSAGRDIVALRKHGIELHFEDSTFTAIHLIGPKGCEGFRPFQGELPFEITFQSSYEDFEKQFGRPDLKYGKRILKFPHNGSTIDLPPIVRYDLENFTMTIGFRDDSFQNITVISFIAPAYVPDIKLVKSLNKKHVLK